MDPRLKQAALDGDVDALYLLIREDPYLLDHFDQIPFVDTPLHIAATTEHTDFAMEVVNLKPSFARKLNPDGFSPLHLALQNEQTEMAFWLLDSDESLARVKGREGMTPLHYIAGREDVYLLAEVLQACPESIKDVNIRGETALHIATKNNIFQALEVLVGWLQRTTLENSKYWEMTLLNWRDKEGNTVLHVAVTNNQHQIVRMLLKRGNVKLSLKNLEGKTPIDILDSKSDMDSRKSRYMVCRAGGLRSSSLPRVMTVVELLRSKVTWLDSKALGIVRRSRDISIDVRNALLIVAILIATVCYQASTSPPGGVWQGNGNDDHRIYGTSVMRDALFAKFLISNTAFLVSALLLVVFLLAYHPYCAPLLTILAYFSCCYGISIGIIFPEDHWSSKLVPHLGVISTSFVMVGGLNMIIFCFAKWLVIRPRQRWKRSTHASKENEVWWEGLDIVCYLKTYLFISLFVGDLVVYVSRK